MKGNSLVIPSSNSIVSMCVNVHNKGTFRTFVYGQGKCFDENHVRKRRERGKFSVYVREKYWWLLSEMKMCVM